MSNTLDFVHDVQQCYRKMVRAMTFPGTLHSIATEAGRATTLGPMDGSTALLALTLLDAETTFFAEADTETIAELTYAPPVRMEEAAYLFANGETSGLEVALTAARGGTLVAPHTGATIVATVSHLLPVTEETERDKNPAPPASLRLRGPGIAGEVTLSVDGHKPEEWLRVRRERNREFPLGVDLFLIDRSANLVALPRTTLIMTEEEA